jgi:cell division protein FtsL
MSNEERNGRPTEALRHRVGALVGLVTLAVTAVGGITAAAYHSFELGKVKEEVTKHQRRIDSQDNRYHELKSSIDVINAKLEYIHNDIKKISR